MQVVLSWTASTTPNVWFYRIYRGFATGGPYQLIGQSNPSPMVGAPTTPTTIPNALTTYTDITNPNNQDGYYVISSVSADGESGYSSEYHAVAPNQPIAPTAISAVIT